MGIWMQLLAADGVGDRRDVGGGVAVSVVHDTAPTRKVTIDETSARRCCTRPWWQVLLASGMPHKRTIRIDVAFALEATLLDCSGGGPGRRGA
jgi:hypothetical protein